MYDKKIFLDLKKRDRARIKLNMIWGEVAGLMEDAPYLVHHTCQRIDIAVQTFPAWPSEVIRQWV